MFSHVVPKTYLKKWEIEDYKDRIYIFKKDEIQKPIRKKLDDLNHTDFGYNNYYYLKIENCNYPIFDSMFNDLLNELNRKYIFKLNKCILTQPGIFRIAYLSNNDSIKVIQKNNNKEIKIKSILTDINNYWRDTQKKYIEQFFSKEIENDWNKIVKNISEIASNQIKNFNIIEKEKFILFIAVQMSRSHKLHNEIINKLLCDENLKKEFLIAHIYKFIKIYNKEQEESNDNIIYCRYKELLKSKLNITILKTNNNFIVSDNPINYYLYNKKKSYLIQIKSTLTFS